MIGLPKWDKVREFPLSACAKQVLPPRGIGLIFTVNGHRVYHKWLSYQLSFALKNAKLPKVTMHSFRHVLNSELLLENVSPYLIQKYLGWTSGSSLTRVQEGYTHVKPSDLQIVADGIDKVFKVAPGVDTAGAGNK